MINNDCYLKKINDLSEFIYTFYDDKSAYNEIAAC